MTKLDFKADKALYKPSHKTFSIVDVPSMQFLMVKGIGNPNGSRAYTDALQTLYPVAYKVKFAEKAEGRDFVVPPLEALWWADDMDAFTRGDKDAWRWQVMIRMPDWVTAATVSRACEIAAEKAPLPAANTLEFAPFHEGLSVQILHIGPYSEEAPTIKRMHDDFMPAHELAPRGKHHEIYLNDPRKTAPEKLKTIIRQPVTRIG